MSRAALSLCVPLAVLLAPACAGKTTPGAEEGHDGATSEPAAPAAPVPPASVPAPFSDCQAKDPIDLAGARIDGDELVLSLQHGGGCAEHRYSLCWSGQAFLESEPVQVQLVPWHDAGGDMCEALVRLEQRFDLAPLRQAHGQEHATIVLQVSGQSVEYAY